MAFLLLLALVVPIIPPMFAALTGSISGTVTKFLPKALPCCVEAIAVKPIGRAATLTKANRSFSLTDLQPDKYTISKESMSIARVTAGSAGSAYQPNQTTDPYKLTSPQITLFEAKDDNTETAQSQQAPLLARFNVQARVS
ncbi:MAG: hypothetical protein IAI50_11280 [Candidatus Eremiobacteraeota bacterium]|nr:hypothetical protein [Candidatus Eremiobacteraeota bacterium]